jgi:hypothetical protein
LTPRFAVRQLDEVAQIAPQPDEPDWYPLQHHFGLTAFGANVYVAREDGADLIADHDEAGSDQEELYLVTAGAAVFTIDGDEFDAPAVTVVAVPDPAVRRSARAKVTGTTVVVVGGERQAEFRSSWQSHHFENVPQL